MRRYWPAIARRLLVGVLIVCITNLAMVSRPGPLRAQATDPFNLTLLPYYPLGFVTPVAINDSGWAVGVLQLYAGGLHPFLYRNGTVTDLFAGCGSCYGIATGLNNLGQVVGWADQLPTGDTYQGFIWQDGSFTILGRMDGYSYRRPAPLAINDQGVVVGALHASESSTLLIGPPFSWQEGSLYPIAGVRAGLASSINNAGQVTGYLCDGPSYCGPGSGLSHSAFRFNVNTGMLETLSTPLGALSKGTAIAPNGDVVGYAYNSYGYYPPTTPVRWHGGTAIDLSPGLPGGDHAQARSVIGSGLIFGCLGPNLGVFDDFYGSIVQTQQYCDIESSDNYFAFLRGVSSSGVVLGPTLQSVQGNRVQTITGMNSQGWFVAIVSGPVGGNRPAIVKPTFPPNLQGLVVKYLSDLCSASTKNQMLRSFDAESALFRLIPSPQLRRAAMQAEASEVSKAREFITNCQKLGYDPFDPDFQIVFSPQFQTLPQLSSDDCITPDMAAVLNTTFDQIGQAVSNFHASGITIDREWSAFTFGDSASVINQDNAVNAYTAAIVDNLSAAQAGLQSVASQIAGTGCDVSVTRSDISAFLMDLQQQGVNALPDGEAEIFQLFGIDPEDAVSLMLSADYSQLPDSVSLSDLFNTIATLLGQAADSLR